VKRVSGTVKDNRGFTLIELVVACGILAVTGTIAMAGYSSWLPRYRVKAAARELYANLQRTRMLAIKNNADCSIKYSAAPDGYVVTGVTKTVTLEGYGSGIRFQGPQGQTFSVPTITFNSRGTCNAGYAYLTDQKNTTYYRVGPPWSSGMIKLEEYVSGKWQ
jgi:prepilin-type N-terminal cleavage/methylation domain-containing protein